MNASMQSAIQQILPNYNASLGQQGEAYAPVNIALIKYWGKRNAALNLPMTDSLSISLHHLGTQTQLALIEGTDQIYLNGTLLKAEHPFVQRTSDFLNYFRPQADWGFRLETCNQVPTGAGLASSASGYAALVLALNDLFQWQLNQSQLSVLARMGSGSACRSLWYGFVHWHAGEREDGMDCYATPLEQTLPQLRIGLITLSDKTKPVSSRSGMQQTVEGLSLYPAWPSMVAKQLKEMQQAIYEQNLSQIGQIAEHNAMAMHATMFSAYPALCYWLPESLATLQQLWAYREQGLACWATMDAGANVKLIFDAKDASDVVQCFPSMQLVEPF